MFCTSSKLLPQLEEPPNALGFLISMLFLTHLDLFGLLRNFIYHSTSKTNYVYKMSLIFLIHSNSLQTKLEFLSLFY